MTREGQNGVGESFVAARSSKRIDLYLDSTSNYRVKAGQQTLILYSIFYVRLISGKKAFDCPTTANTFAPFPLSFKRLFLPFHL